MKEGINVFKEKDVSSHAKVNPYSLESGITRDNTEYC
jgi:hypothetical protein